MNHSIGLDQAKAMTKKYRDNRNDILKPEHQGHDLLSICETFDKAPFEQLLKQEGLAQVRVYFGMKDDLRVHAIIVGVDANGKDMLPTAATATATTTVSSGTATLTSTSDITTDPGTTTTTDPIIIEEGQLCPPACPTDTTLTGG